MKFPSRVKFVVNALLFACLLTSGNPEVTIFTLLLIFAFVAFESRCRRFPFFSAKLISPSLAFLLGLALTAPLVFVFSEYALDGHHLHRSGYKMSFKFRTLESHFYTIFNPVWLTHSIGYRPDTAKNFSWDLIGGYLGFACFALSVVSVLLRHKCRAIGIFFFCFGWWILLKNMQVVPFNWLGYIPLMELSWSHRWAGPAWTLAFALSAGIGFDALCAVVRTQPSWFQSLKKWVPAGAVFVLSEALAVVSYLLVRSWFPLPYLGLLFISAVALSWYFLLRVKSRTFPVIALSLILIELWFWIPRGYEMKAFYSMYVFSLGLITLAVLFGYFKKYIIVPLVALFALSLIYDPRPNKGLPKRHDPFTKAPYIKFLEDNLGDSRIVGGYGLLIANYASAYEFPDLRYCSSVSIERYHQFRMMLLDGPAGERMTFRGGKYDAYGNIFRSLRKYGDLYSMMGVKYILSKKDFDLREVAPHRNYKLAYDKEIRIFENKDVFPRVFFPESLKFYPSQKEIIQLMRMGTHNFRKVALVDEDSVPDFLTPEETFSPAIGSITKYESDHVEIETQSEGRSLLVLSDTYYKGWVARIGENPIPMFPVHGFLRGMIVPKGKHKVTLSYEPKSFWWGVWIALGASLFLVLLLVVPYFERLVVLRPVPSNLSPAS